MNERRGRQVYENDTTPITANWIPVYGVLNLFIQPRSLQKEKFTLRKIKGKRAIVLTHSPNFESPFVTVHPFSVHAHVFMN